MVTAGSVPPTNKIVMAAPSLARSTHDCRISALGGASRLIATGFLSTSDAA